MPLYYEDMTPGTTWTTAARTISEADVVNFAGVSGDFNWIHIDAEATKDSPFGGRIAHGLLVLSVVTGLRMQSGLFTGTVIAFLGLESWNFKKAVMIGDTIHAEVGVLEARETSKPGRGIVKQQVTVRNQDGDVVQEGIFVTMMKRRQADEAGE